jgi:hypothetical protein
MHLAAQATGHASTRASRALKLVNEWTSLHREELEADWERTRGGGTPEPIDPLP